MSLVTDTAFAEPSVALAHFERRLALETDCSDVHEALKATLDFVLVDVRGAKLFEQAHVPCAVNIPHRTMTAERMAQYGKDACSSSIARVRIATARTRRRSSSPGSAIA